MGEKEWGPDRWRVAVPGWPQWRRGDRESGFVLFGSFASAVMVGGFAWGSALGAGLIGVAFVTHCASVADAIRRSAFPGYSGWARWFASAVGLGVVGYGPALMVMLNLAYPAQTAEGGFWVDRSSYASRGPEPGQRVWLEGEGPGEPRRIGRVVAVEGQLVSWDEGRLLVDGRAPESGEVSPPSGPMSQGRFDVPARTVLVLCEDRGCFEGDSGGECLGSGRHLAIVAREQVLGRAWARSYPLWDRRLLG